MAFASLINASAFACCWRYYSVPAERWPLSLRRLACGDYFADGASGVAFNRRPLQSAAIGFCWGFGLLAAVLTGSMSASRPLAECLAG